MCIVYGSYELISVDPEILFTSHDSFELLRILEEVMTNASFAPDEYLFQLRQYLRRSSGAEDDEKSGMVSARRKMEEVRLALARNLARALIIGFDNPF